MLGRIILQDIRKGFHKNAGRWALYLIFLLFFVLSKYYAFSQIFDHLTGIGLICISILSGIKEYIPDFSNPINFPVNWVILVSFLPFLLGDYIKNDMQGMGIHKILLSGRGRWWIGKCAYIIVTAVLYVCLIYVVPILVCMVGSGLGLGQKLSTDFLMYTYGYSDLYANPHEFWGYVVVLPVFFCLAIAVWTSILGMIWSPEKAFMVIVSYLVAGIFYMNPLLIGNQMMLFRCAYLNENGIVLSSGLWIDSILIVAGILIGINYIEKKDMI